MRGEAPVEGEEPNERVPNSRGSSRGSQSSRERERRRGGTSSRERPRSDGRGASASKSAAEGGSGGGEAAPSSSTRRPISLTQTPGPTPLDEYDVIKAIGKGKFAIVYRARHRATGTFVAIKLVKTADMPEKKRNKCLKEVRLLASLDHSNIIRCFQSFVLDSNLFLVLEWAEAGDLKRQIRKANERNSRFHERLIWSYFSQLADAVAHMHEHRIMHRDLKPANIFLTAQAKVKVGDLGLGRHFSEKTEHVFSKVGTPLYMSPEVLQGGGYDWKSDVWSLGCILYELAVLKSPFKEPGLKLYGLFKKITRGVFDPVPDHYSPVLREMTSRMIDINVARCVRRVMSSRGAESARSRAS
jgi:NIMA (never in mitosis gene a)-related kinase|tara:strand:+ start:123 stop:1193 length:1071 start_codon:yes stop_codon:yes gene_type:complete